MVVVVLMLVVVLVVLVAGGGGGGAAEPPCDKVPVWSATVRVALRPLGAGFAPTVYAMVPSPVPVVPLVMLTHAGRFCTVQEQALPV